MVVKVFNYDGEEQSIFVNKMTDISTVMFAVLKTFQEEVNIDEIISKNTELTERVEELEEVNDAVDTALRQYGYDELDELTGAYDDACKLLSEIHDMTYDYH